MGDPEKHLIAWMRAMENLAGSSGPDECNSAMRQVLQARHAYEDAVEEAKPDDFPRCDAEKAIRAKERADIVVALRDRWSAARDRLEREAACGEPVDHWITAEAEWCLRLGAWIEKGCPAR